MCVHECGGGRGKKERTEKERNTETEGDTRGANVKFAFIKRQAP